MRSLCAFVLATVVWLAAVEPSPAAAQKRVALVIGNSAYRHAPALANPRNDAGDVIAALKKHRFQIVEGLDVDKVGFDRKVREFAVALEGAEVGLFFYAGHGLQVAGQNYLMPVDAELANATSLEFEMIRLDVVQRIMERQTQTNLLFLDACRDNPLARNLARSLGTRSTEIGRGLAAVESGVGTLISFSTQPGNVALDGRDRNSPFAAALVKHISSSSDDLSAILIAVRNDVMKATQRKQVPWEHSALTGRFYFAPPVSPPAPAVARPAPFTAVSAGGLFTEANAKQIRALAEKHRLPLPDFHIEVPKADVPAALRRFVGIWANDPPEGRYRTRLLVVTRVDRDGKLDGWWVYGPPGSHTRSKDPPGFFAVAGTISAGALRFANPSRTATYRFTPVKGRAMNHLYANTKTGETGAETFKPLWTLAEAEREAKR
jgi:uncharacterized caspase-like protein